MIPFHIFSHEDRFAKYEQDEGQRRLLEKEYGKIRERLEEKLEEGLISEYVKCTIIDMSNKVLENIAQKYDLVREGVRDVMGGKALDYEAKTILNEGMEKELALLCRDCHTGFMLQFNGRTVSMQSSRQSEVVARVMGGDKGKLSL